MFNDLYFGTQQRLIHVLVACVGRPNRSQTRAEARPIEEVPGLESIPCEWEQLQPSQAHPGNNRKHASAARIFTVN